MKPLLIKTSFAALCLFSSYTLATNGYFLHGYGTVSKGMAGAGSALPQDVLVAATNPAGIVSLESHWEAGLALFFPERGYTADDNSAPGRLPPSIPPGKESSDIPLFPLPSFGINWRLDDVSAVSLTLVGNGMNTEYDTTTFQNFAPRPGSIFNPSGELTATKPTGATIIQMLVGLNYARQITPHNAIGIMPILGIQAFDVKGVEPFRLFSQSPDHVSNNGFDWTVGGGVRVGWLGSPIDNLNLSASYQSKIYMTSIDKYKGLLAEQGEFDIPANLTLGIAFKPAKNIAIVFDWQRIFYGDIAALNNPNDQIRFNPDTGQIEVGLPLGSDKGMGFGWDDIDIYKLGVQWQYSNKWTFRAGYSWASELFEGSQGLFNILAPATVREHLSLGLTHQLNEKSQVQLSYTHAFKEEIFGSNPLFTGQQTGSVWMYQHELELTWSSTF